MEWLDDVTYAVACALLLALLVKELMSTVSHCVPLSWLPRNVIFSVEPMCENLPGIANTQRDISTQVSESDFRRSDLSLTSVPRDPEVSKDKVKAECNGDICDVSLHERCYTDCLKRQVDELNAELHQCRQLIADLRQSEQNLRQRFEEKLRDDFDKKRDGKFENICLDDNSRPTSLIRRFNNIYSDERVELLDVLEQNGQGQNDLEQGRTEFHMKSCQETIVSIIVECFNESQRKIEQLMNNMHTQLMQLRNSARITTAAAAAAADDDGKDDDFKSQLQYFDDALFGLLRKVAHHHDFSSTAEAIYERLQLDKHISIKNSNEFRRYVTTCAQLAWSLTAQRPSYELEYQLKGAMFDADRHERFHTSDSNSSVIRELIWPGLIELPTRFCVSKAVVIT